MPLPIVLSLLAALAAQSAQSPITVADKAKLASYLPLPTAESADLAGWRRAGEPAFYVEDNLYEYVDGADQEYFSYGFRLVATATYARADRALPNVTVDIYDMGRDINAFGIYALGRQPNVEVLDIGTQSFLMKGYLFCWKGPYYVKVTPMKPTPEVRPAVIAFAKATAAAIPAPAGTPRLLSLLPKKGMLPLTEGYARVNVIGQEYLRNAVSARYKAKGGELELLIADFENPPAAEEALAKFRTYQSTPPRTAQSMAGFGDAGFEGDDPYYKHLMVAAAATSSASSASPTAPTAQASSDAR
jgi:hypothetical protein